MSERAREQRTWEDIRYVCVLQAEPKYADVNAQFKLYHVTGLQDNGEGEYNVPIFELPEAGSSADTTTDVEAAACELEVTIKWDGCAHWNPATYWHTCGRDNVDHLIEAINRTWAWAKELGMDRLDAE